MRLLPPRISISSAATPDSLKNYTSSTFLLLNVSGVFKQRYRGDITIVPNFAVAEAVGLKAVLNPTVEDMKRYLGGGLRAEVAAQIARTASVLMLICFTFGVPLMYYEIIKQHTKRYASLPVRDRADAAAMRQDEVALQGRRVGGVDPDRGEFAEAGIDAVDGCIAGRDRGNAGGGLFDGGIAGGIHPHGIIAAIDFFQRGQRHAAGGENKRHRETSRPPT